MPWSAARTIRAMTCSTNDKEGDGLAILIMAVCRGNGPAAGSDCMCAGTRDGLGATGIPCVVKVIDNNSGRETSARVSAQFKGADAAGRQAAVSRGNTVYQIPAAEMEKWQAAAAPVSEEWIKDVSARGRRRPRAA
jgi:hypothetical protein